MTLNLGKFLPKSLTGSIVKESLSSSPSICFEISFQPVTGRIMVHVIGARCLPTRLGLSKQLAYVAKVKMFPGNEKLQTERCRDPNPSWNEFFAFEGAKGAGGSGLPGREKAIIDAFDRGKFIVFTIIAIDTTEKQTTLGAVTLTLERKLFSEAKGGGIQFETGRLWHPLSNIDAGLSKAQRSSTTRRNVDGSALSERAERAGKGSVEMSLCFCPGPDSNSEAVLTVALTRLRWQITSAKELQSRKADLFVKVKITTGLGGTLLGKYRSEKFSPCISVNLTPKTSRDCLMVVLEPSQHTRGPIYGHVRLYAKFRLGKKEKLGEAWFGMGQAVPQFGRDLWMRSVQQPGTKVSDWLPLI